MGWRTGVTADDACGMLRASLEFAFRGSSGGLTVLKMGNSGIAAMP